MIRVNKTHPCPVCQKPDWCLYSEDGSAAICNRIQEGSKKRCGDAGWLHILTPGIVPFRKPVKKYTPKPLIDFRSKNEKYVAAITSYQIEELSALLGVTTESLIRLGIGRNRKAYTFPMCDENRNIIGIRQRFGNGSKCSAVGSSNGLFIPDGLAGYGELYICEGPTDTAVGLDLGLEVIGRPNCNSRVDMTVKFARGRKVTILADSDTVGVMGARELYKRLTECCPKVTIILPPPGFKDLRQWKQKKSR